MEQNFQLTLTRKDSIIGLSYNVRYRKNMNDARITLRVPRELYDEAKAKAEREDITLSQILRRCLRAWLAGIEVPTPPLKPELDGEEQSGE